MKCQNVEEMNRTNFAPFGWKTIRDIFFWEKLSLIQNMSKIVQAGKKIIKECPKKRKQQLKYFFVAA